MPGPLDSKFAGGSYDRGRGAVPGMVPGPDGRLYPRNVNQRLWPPNEFNSILGMEGMIWSRIQRCGGLQAICPGMKYSQPPWIKQPVQGKRFSKISSIALPAADGTDNLVVSFVVPTGYDGVIISNVNEYTGTGFQEGSGDLVWRVQLNRRWVKDYGAITTTIGSLVIPYSVNNGAIRLQSGMLVRYWVNRSVGSLGNLDGGRIICGLFGWFYPR
jgi:hypothetical protein